MMYQLSVPHILGFLTLGSIKARVGTGGLSINMAIAPKKKIGAKVAS